MSTVYPKTLTVTDECVGGKLEPPFVKFVDSVKNKMIPLRRGRNDIKILSRVNKKWIYTKN